MADSFRKRLAHAFTVFRTPEEKVDRIQAYNYGPASGVRPDRNRLRMSNERSIISALYTRIGIDVASIDLRHVMLDQNGRYIRDMPSGLNNCLTLEANLDQGARQFKQDIAMSMFDQGVVAVVPVETDLNPDISGGYNILNMRVAPIVQWHPNHVQVDLYNERTGQRELVTLAKRNVAIVENPLYSVMNEPNSTLQRLIRKLNLLDAVDEQSGSGKLDLIIQLPYVIKSDARKQQAEDRRAAIEEQLQGSKYGIAYTDGTEKVTQLNRPSENNMLKQVEYLTAMLYGQLGLTESVFNGTADEKTMLNYHNRTIEPILTAIQQAMKRSFLTKTARTQGQSIEFFRDPFKLVPVSELAEIADKFTRNEILSSNEVRSIIGMKPVDDPAAEELRNKNLMPKAVEEEPYSEELTVVENPPAILPTPIPVRALTQ